MPNAIRVVDTIEEIGSAYTSGQFPRWSGSAFAGKMLTDNWFNVIPDEFAATRYLTGSITSSPVNVALAVPSGYKAIVNANGSNLTGGTAILTWNLTRGGTTYITAYGGVFSGGAGVFYFLVASGDTLAISSSRTGAALVVSMSYFLVPDNHANLKVISTPLASGDNTLYTCPASRKAQLLKISTHNVAGYPHILISNNSGVARAINIYLVPSGGTVGDSNKIYVYSQNSGSLTAYEIGAYAMIAGDQLVVNTNGTGVLAQCLIWETDA